MWIGRETGEGDGGTGGAWCCCLWSSEGLCGICGQVLSGNDPTQWEVDEIMPRSMGGGEEQWNLQVTHGRCRVGKAEAWEGSQGAQRRKWARWKL